MIIPNKMRPAINVVKNRRFILLPVSGNNAWVAVGFFLLAFITSGVLVGVLTTGVPSI
jgi:hypothetical protein